MARKKDSDETKSTRKGRAKTVAGAPATRGRKSAAASARAAASPAPSRARKARKSSLEAVRLPVADTTAKVGKKAKKALKAAKSRALNLVPEVHAPAVPNAVGDAFKSIGTQIAGALNTDIGRVMMAELLIYVAKSLTKAASESEAGEGAKAAIVSAGAKIGAAAADAGARMVETGHAAADSGAKLLDDGKSAASGAAGSAGDLVREVAQVAVGAVGGVVADVAKRAISRRGRKPAAAGENTATSGAPTEPADRSGGRRTSTRGAATTPAGGDTASPVSAESGHRPPAI